MASKKFDYGVGMYYFSIRNSAMNSITIKRTNKGEAVRSYLSYKKVGKNCEWLGKWAGKKFEETGAPSLKEA